MPNWRENKNDPLTLHTLLRSCRRYPMIEKCKAIRPATGIRIQFSPKWNQQSFDFANVAVFPTSDGCGATVDVKAISNNVYNKPWPFRYVTKRALENGITQKRKHYLLLIPVLLEDRVAAFFPRVGRYETNLKGL